MSLINKLTEEEARELLNTIDIRFSLHSIYTEIIKSWKEKGFIKETTLDKARKNCDIMKKYLPVMPINAVYAIHNAIEGYEEVIYALQEKLKEDKK